MVNKPVPESTISNNVNHELIKQRINQDHNVKQFVAFGKKLLEETERDNVITYAQFEPFIPLFNRDDERLKTDSAYRAQIARLYDGYVNGLGINLYRPTIIIDNETDRNELAVFPQVFTRFRSDAVEGAALRDTVPAAISKTADTTRDTLLLEASALDLMNANSTPEMKEYFGRMKMETAIINKAFYERNLSDKKRQELGLSETTIVDENGESTPAPQSDSGITFVLNDDD